MQSYSTKPMIVEKGILEVWDASGRLIWNDEFGHSHGGHKFQINGSKWKQGLYHLRLQSKDSLVQEKIIL